MKLKFRLVIEGEYQVDPEQYPEAEGISQPYQIAGAEEMNIESAPTDFLFEHHLQITGVTATVTPLENSAVSS